MASNTWLLVLGLVGTLTLAVAAPGLGSSVSLVDAPATADGGDGGTGGMDGGMGGGAPATGSGGVWWPLFLLFLPLAATPVVLAQADGIPTRALLGGGLVAGVGLVSWVVWSGLSTVPPPDLGDGVRPVAVTVGAALLVAGAVALTLRGRGGSTAVDGSASDAETNATDATADAVGTTPPTPPAVGADPDDNAVYRAYARLAAATGDGERNGNEDRDGDRGVAGDRTPQEVAAAARAAGHDPRAVERIVAGFEAVRYGGEPVDGAIARRVESADDRLFGGR